MDVFDPGGAEVFRKVSSPMRTMAAYVGTDMQVPGGKDKLVDCPYKNR